MNVNIISESNLLT